MIRPASEIVVQCDGCGVTETFAGHAFSDLSASQPPAGWSELTGYLDAVDPPTRKRLLNRHLCPACLPQLGKLLRRCGIEIYTVPTTEAPP